MLSTTDSLALALVAASLAVTEVVGSILRVARWPVVTAWTTWPDLSVATTTSPPYTGRPRCVLR
ncbi:hypothetical protein [Microtetraspora malaysiensis]|uniref:Uncharacterized protein n=1 Tax=Microtetraspora malaysiensis TaxID=161358 RepID=A0ABW6STL9_9ACTN